jgi:ABC-2 type transport system ATP-binding protein
LQRLLKKLAASGKTIIYSTHILETVEKLCSKVIIIHQGSLVADTGVEELQRLKENPTLEQVFSNLALDQNPDEIAELIVGALE